MSAVKPSRLYQDLAATTDEKAARSLAKALGGLYDDLSRRLTKEDLPRLEDAFRHMVESCSQAAKSPSSLTEAYRRTEAALTKLAEAAAETQAALQELTRRGGGTSDDGGHAVENSVFPYVTEFARREYGLELTTLDRSNIEYPDGRFDEIYLYVEGSREGSRELLVADAKAHPGKRDIDRFAEWVGRITAGVDLPVHSLVIGHSASPEVERYIHDRYPQIRLVHGEELELRYDRLKSP